jgi:hypothetical protein
MRLDTPTLVIDEQGNRGPVTPDVGVGSGHDDVYQHRFMTSVDVMKFKSFLSVTLGAGRLGLQEVLPEGLGGGGGRGSEVTPWVTGDKPRAPPPPRALVTFDLRVHSHVVGHLVPDPWDGREESARHLEPEGEGRAGQGRVHSGHPPASLSPSRPSPCLSPRRRPTSCTSLRAPARTVGLRRLSLHTGAHRALACPQPLWGGRERSGDRK